MQPQNTILLRTRQTFAYIGLFGCFSIFYYTMGIILTLHDSTINTFVGAFVAIAIYYFIVKKYVVFTVRFQVKLLVATYILLPILIFISLKTLEK